MEQTMESSVGNSPRSIWRKKKNHLWALGAFGVLHGLLLVGSVTFLQEGFGVQLFINFTLNVVLLGWCFTDAEGRMVAISGLLRVAMLSVCAIGIPWYFIRSRGVIGALKGAFGFGLFVVWFSGFFLGLFSGAILQTLLPE